jgi:hypothetical protein
MAGDSPATALVRVLYGQGERRESATVALLVCLWFMVPLIREVPRNELSRLRYLSSSRTRSTFSLASSTASPVFFLTLAPV